MAKARTLFDKIWDSHVVHRQEDGTCVLYIDRHLVHEVTSPQAFEGLRLAGRKVRRPEATLAVADHNVPTERPQPGHRRRGKPHPGRDAGAERARLRRALLCHGRHPSGHRPHHRAGAGPDPAGHDHRLRRQPHLDPWRLRRAGLRHRHVRGRARAGDPDAPAASGQEHARHGRRRPAGRRHRQGRRSWRSSARSAPPAAPATSSNTPARRSATFPWKAA